MYGVLRLLELSPARTLLGHFASLLGPGSRCFPPSLSSPMGSGVCRCTRTVAIWHVATVAKKNEGFTCADRPLVTTFGHAIFRNRLRDIQARLRVQPAKLYCMGVRYKMTPNTVANADATWDWCMDADFAHRLIRTARSPYVSEPLHVPLDSANQLILFGLRRDIKCPFCTQFLHSPYARVHDQASGFIWFRIYGYRISKSRELDWGALPSERAAQGVTTWRVNNAEPGARKTDSSNCSTQPRRITCAASA